jgi:hypothetical protein
VVRRVVFLGRKLTRRQNETTSFERNMLHGALPSIARVDGRSAVDLRSERVIVSADWG